MRPSAFDLMNSVCDAPRTMPSAVITRSFSATRPSASALSRSRMRVGTFETKFTIPDLTASQRYLSVSSVVLGYQREKLSAALASAEKDKKLMAGNPLVHDGQKLIPSVTRVFRSDQNMYVYM